MGFSVKKKKKRYFAFWTSVINWFESYLSNREFLVCVDNVFSEAGLLKYGVPQGSPNNYRTQAPICMQMTPVFSTNMKALTKSKIF